jgi:hypothetical protein
MNSALLDAVPRNGLDVDDIDLKNQNFAERREV